MQTNLATDLDDGCGGLTTHVMDGVLITKPVGTLDLFLRACKFLNGVLKVATRRVIHMPPPIILGHVLTRCNTLDIEILRSPENSLRVQH